MTLDDLREVRNTITYRLTSWSTMGTCHIINTHKLDSDIINTQKLRFHVVKKYNVLFGEKKAPAGMGTPWHPMFREGMQDFMSSIHKHQYSVFSKIECLILKNIQK